MRNAYTSIRGYVLLDAGEHCYSVTDWCHKLLKKLPIRVDTGEVVHTHIVVSNDFPRVFAPRTDGSYFVRTPVEPVYVMIEGELTDEAVEEAYSNMFEWLFKLRYAAKLEDISITIRGDSLTHKYRKLEMDTSTIE